MSPRHPLLRPALHLFAALALLAGAGASMAASHLPPVTDIAAQSAAAAQQGEPLVILVSLPDCTFCETARRNYLAPQTAAGEITARELDMTADTPIRDADGTMTTAKQWARARNISVAPTVLFLDRNGRNLAAPLRGMQGDFYGAYLEQAMDTARAKLAERPAAAK
ncbi:thioredoxin [Cupriavidus sp. BIS7]|uniref:thioredoxin n=1 Tax=Cupriavidus sp. BIS7 TaxID=1217718 RepID=UPI0003809E9D|nr:thioredoxin [Cupriavidus sp. BIS7]